MSLTDSSNKDALNLADFFRRVDNLFTSSLLKEYFTYVGWKLGIDNAYYEAQNTRFNNDGNLSYLHDSVLLSLMFLDDLSQVRLFDLEHIFEAIKKHQIKDMLHDPKGQRFAQIFSRQNLQDFEASKQNFGGWFDAKLKEFESSAMTT